MYERLYNTIATFSVLFILISFLMSMSKYFYFIKLYCIFYIILETSGVLKFPWQWEWMQQVSWEVLNFSALAVVCIICSPSGIYLLHLLFMKLICMFFEFKIDNSRLLSYVSQLPTEDPGIFI